MTKQNKMTNYRWMICAMLFFATMVNYLDRQVLSLTWKDFISPEFHWTNDDYGNITSLFSLFYAICMLFAGRIVDWLDTKKGFLWAIGVWSFGAVLHAFCGIATSGITTGSWLVGFEGARQAIATVGDVGTVMNVSVTLFIFARFVLALGEAGNFPAAIKATAEYFPKKDRAFSTSVFNAGSTIGALAAPLTIPDIAKHFGWEMAFIIIGALGFIWMGFWVFIYKKPEVHPKVNKAELDYIQQDKESAGSVEEKRQSRKLSFLDCFKFKQTWAFAFGKFMTDGVWWFYLFWMPAYLSDVYGFKSSMIESKVAIFVIYAIVMLSLYGGKLPTIIINKTGKDPYAARMQAMLIFAFFPLLALLAQPLGGYSYWIPVIIIGIAGAAHQSWSANIFSTVGDMFPKSAIATVTGIGGMAGGIGSVLINKGSGMLFDYTQNTQMELWGFKGIDTGYMIIFSICAVAYLIGWIVMKSLVPNYKPI
ncbi:MAG: MFS transporter [Dysgonamonadaceae bacterium]|jgi:ACS family hexuronate transporter-like MFS transporter|nr:MFS transporter [Dysgonamonadaceae bacterium]